MNSRQCITLGAAAVCAAVGLAAAGYERQHRPPEGLSQQLQTPAAAAASPVEDQPLSAAEGEAPCYLLGESEGRLAVFVEGSDQPEMVLEVYLSSLPEADRILLEQGIPAESYERLVSLLEDYVS